MSQVQLPSVLVVDDNRELAENIAEILELEGIDSTIAIDGASALSALRKSRFDMVITDIRMPGMNGVELVRAIRNQWPAMLVVVMSAYSSDATLDEAVAAGALDVLFKPVDLEVVVKLIHRLATQRAPILVVEDDRHLRINLTELLMGETDSVPYAVADLATARRLLDDVKFRVAIVDVRLPDGDGLAFGRDLLERFGDDFSLLHITAFSDDVHDDRPESQDSESAVSVLEKPFAPSQLLAFVKRMSA